MEKRVGVFYGGVNLKEAAETACGALRRSFVGIEPIMLSALEVPEKAFDSCMGHYEVQALLNCLFIPDNMNMVLWIVDKKIGNFWQPCLFGAAGNARAVVSSATFGRAELAVRVACHETGHLLGLGHCRKHCCMRHSSSLTDLERKPETLCKTCLSTLQAR